MFGNVPRGALSPVAATRRSVGDGRLWRRLLHDLSNAHVASVLRVKVTAEAARRFLVGRHFLAPARSLSGGLDGVLEVFQKFGSIQFDPIAVAGRNHDLVLHARVAGYEPAWCDVLYERREIFEATNK